MLLLVWAGTVVGLASLLQPLVLPGLTWTRPDAVRSALLVVLVATYLINGLALSVAEARHFRRHRAEQPDPSPPSWRRPG